MADGTQVGSTADILLTDDLATRNGGAYTGQKVQVVKIGYGVDSDMKEVNATTQLLPVNISGSAGGSAQTTQNLTAAGASTLAGSASGASACVLDVSQAGNASFAILATTSFVGTVVFEMSFDPAGSNGTWAPVPCAPEDVTTPPVSTLVLNVGALFVRQFTTGMFGARLFRVRCSVFTSGTLTVVGVGGPGWYEGQPALAPSNAVIGAVSLAAATTYAVTSVNTSGVTNTNTVLLAADTTRKGLLIRNGSTAALLIGFGTTTTTTLFSVSIPAGQTYEVPPQFAPSAINGMTTPITQPINFTTAV
jgi:hypothetical protein